VITLNRLVNVLGGYGVRLHFCSVPRSTELRTVVMHKNADGRVVLGDVFMAPSKLLGPLALQYPRLDQQLGMLRSRRRRPGDAATGAVFGGTVHPVDDRGADGYAEPGADRCGGRSHPTDRAAVDTSR
jgi:hypothetical protein